MDTSDKQLSTALPLGGRNAAEASSVERSDKALSAEELEETVRRAGRGDEEAVSWLFEQYHPRVYRYALARLGMAHDAEDVAAEAFTTVVRKVASFRWRGAGFEAWLFKIAANAVVDRHRRRARDPVELREDSGFENRAGGQESDQALLDAERGSELRALLDRLPADQREVLLLRFAGELSADEVGQVMGRKPNAVRQLQFRALEGLRRRMGEEQSGG